MTRDKVYMCTESSLSWMSCSCTLCSSVPVRITLRLLIFRMFQATSLPDPHPIRAHDQSIWPLYSKIVDSRVNFLKLRCRNCSCVNSLGWGYFYSQKLALLFPSLIQIIPLCMLSDVRWWVVLDYARTTCFNT